MPCPPNHEPFYSYADATRALASLVRIAKKTGKGGKSWKRLNVFECGNHYHVGRAKLFNSSYQNRKTPKPQPEPKPPTVGELRRKLQRMEQSWTRREDYQRRQRAEAIGKLIAAENAIEEAKQDYVRAQREVLALFFPNQ